MLACTCGPFWLAVTGFNAVVRAVPAKVLLPLPTLAAPDGHCESPRAVAGGHKGSPDSHPGTGTKRREISLVTVICT